MKIKSGDLVSINVGKNKGKTGVIKKVFPELNRVVIDQVNSVKRHQKPSSKYPKGGIIEKFLPVSSSNVNLICPSCKKITRIGYKITPQGKHRICKKCQEVMS